MALRARSQVPVEEMWRLEDIFPSEAAWEAEYAALSAALPELGRYRGRLAEGPGVLLECLEARERFWERLDRVVSYAYMCYATDAGSPVNQGLFGRARDLQARAQAALAYLRSELVQLPPGRLAEYAAAEAGLAPYAAYLEEVQAEQPHALSPETEDVLATLSEVLNAPATVYRAATGADIQFAPVQDSQGREVPVSLMGYLMSIEISPDTALRRRAYASLIQGLKPHQHTLAATLATTIKRNVLIARLRGYPTTAHMLLRQGDMGRRPDAISVETYEQILDLIQTELAPHMRRLARLRRRVLGLDRVLLCDVKAALDPGYDPQLTFAEAAGLITDSVAVMGPEYSEIVRRAFRENWIDRADNAGRIGAAFCLPVYGVHPYVFSAFTGSLYSAFVLAHELGHAVHMELTMRHQRLSNAGYSRFFVEAPSTLAEHLLAHHLKSTSQDPRLHRWVNTFALNTFHHNFVTHLLEGELLRRLYRLAEQGEPITAAVLCREKLDALARFWGDTVELDEGAGLTWMRQGHYYAELYPYSYAAGLAASTVVAQQILTEGAPAARRWVEVLKAGASRPPLELFRMMGIDMAAAAPLRAAVAHVGTLVDEPEASFSG